MEHTTALDNHTRNDQSVELTSPDFTELPAIKAVYALWSYVSPILLTVGLIGNSLAVIVLSRKKVRETATAVFLIALACADTLLLLTWNVEKWFRIGLGIRMRSYSLVACKVHAQATHFAGHMAPWILVLLSFERLVAVYLPIRHKVWFSRKKAILIILSLSLICFLYDIHDLFVYTILGNECVINKNFKASAIVIMKIDILLLTVGPFHNHVSHNSGCCYKTYVK